MSDILMYLSKGDAQFGDIVIENGDLVLNDGLTAIRQNILQRLRTFFGEWFLDNTIGLPYFEQIWVKNPDQSKIDALFQNAILGTPGVVSLNEYSFVPDFQKRTLNIAFVAQTTSGTVDYAGLV